MRFLLVGQVPTEQGDAAIRDGSLPVKIQKVMEDLKLEAAYFTAVDGARTALFIVDVPEASSIPAVAEPIFLAFGATVEFFPLMTAEDLMKAGPAIAAAAQRHS